MTKVYISSPLRLDKVNCSIATLLQEYPQLDVFLPISLDTNSNTPKNALHIAERCYEEIDKSDIIILVIPFGLSVAAEIGYTINLKRSGQKKVIIGFHSGLGTVNEEFMLDPYIDYHTGSFEELLKQINQLRKNEEGYHISLTN